MMEGSFLAPNLEICLVNLGYLLKKSLKTLVEERGEILGLSSIFFKRANEWINHLKT